MNLAAITHRRIFIFRILNNRLSTKVPLKPIIPLEKKQKTTFKVDSNTIALLERLSLVKCDTTEGIEVLEDSITFANKILHIDTENIEPLYSVLENENLSLRSDEITQGNCQAEVLKNAMITEDDYFVAPPGNIPLNEIHEEDTLNQSVKENEN